MNHSIKGLYRGLYKGLAWGILRGDTRSLDYGSYLNKKENAKKNVQGTCAK